MAYIERNQISAVRTLLRDLLCSLVDNTTFSEPFLCHNNSRVAEGMLLCVQPDVNVFNVSNCYPVKKSQQLCCTQQEVLLEKETIIGMEG